MRFIYIIFSVFVFCFVHAQDPPRAVPGSIVSVTPQKVGTSVSIKPEYPGGNEAFYTFVNSNFKTPRVPNAMRARIVVVFVVERDGTMTNFKVVEDPGYGLGDEALRVLKLCKERWSPGTIDGRTVRASYRMPITINIK